MECLRVQFVVIDDVNEHDETYVTDKRIEFWPVAARPAICRLQLRLEGRKEVDTHAEQC